MRPGVTLRQAQSESIGAMRDAILAVESRKRPLTDQERQDLVRDDYGLESVERGVSPLRTRFGTGLLVLFGGAALLLLLSCANIAGLLLARAAAREREMAVRTALGATRAHLMRHWLAESTLLAAAGGAAGLLLARAVLPFVGDSLPAIRDLGTVLVPVALDAALDSRAIAFTLAVCCAAALLAGLAPAWHAWRANLNDALKSTSPDPRRARLRTLLTVAQVAIGTLASPSPRCSLPPSIASPPPPPASTAITSSPSPWIPNSRATPATRTALSPRVWNATRAPSPASPGPPSLRAA